MEMDSHDSYRGFLNLILQHPAIQDNITEFVTMILRQALSVSEIREQVVESISGTDIGELLSGKDSAQKKKPTNMDGEELGRRQITARDASKILRYNPHYFSRKAKDWGLTKIRMSRTSCRYYLDEVQQLAIDRGVRNTA